MNDPSSSINAAPPRYLLESDSSDEEGQGGYPGPNPEYGLSSRARAQAQAQASASKGASGPRISLARLQGISKDGSSYKEAIVAVGQAGRYVVRKLGLKVKGSQGQGVSGTVVLPTATGDERVGEVYELGQGEGRGKVLLLCVEEQEGERAWAVVKGLQGSVEAEKWTILTTYLPSTYIPSSASSHNPRSDPPIRSILPKQSSHDWHSPNYLTGITAGLFSLAAHPSSSLNRADLSILLLPLPLSSVSGTAYSSALESASSALAGLTSNAGHASNAGKTRWDEADDEPYVAQGMGRRNQPGGKKEREEMGGMYM